MKYIELYMKEIINESVFAKMSDEEKREFIQKWIEDNPNHPLVQGAKKASEAFLLHEKYKENRNR